MIRHGIYTRARITAALVLAVATVVCLVPARPAFAAGEGGPLTQQCREADERLRGPCRGTEQIVSAGSAACRWTGAPSDACTTPLGPRVSRSAVRRYADSWAHRALTLQYELAGDVGLRNTPWIGTHNSFNSTAEMGPTLSDTDSNQQLSVKDQLRLDVRSLELDVHLFPSLGEELQTPVVCHALENHGGCSVEKPLKKVLAQIAGWLRENPRQVLLLYLEDHLDNARGYHRGASVLESRMGDLLYRPPAGGCTGLPMETSRDDILAAGAQVIVMSDCGEGGEWPALVFHGRAREETRPRGYRDFPDCGDYSRTTYDSTIIRYFEDSTGVTAGAATFGAANTDDGITPETAGRMARCGVDLLGMDQLLADDGRLEALVWSWAPGEPGTAGDCAVQRPDARWEARDCAEQHPAACRSGSAWSVTAAPVAAADAGVACAAAGAEHAVPRTGYEGQLLRVAAGTRTVWLGHRRAGGGWQALDPR